MAAKAEYLYMDFGSVSANISGGVGATNGNAGNCYGAPLICNGPLPTAAFGTATSRFTDNIVRVGVNCKFWPAVGPANVD